MFSWQRDSVQKRPQTPVEAPFRSFLNRSQQPGTERFSDELINLHRFRSNLQERVSPLIQEERRYTDVLDRLSVPRQQNKARLGGISDSIPTFDALEKSIRGYSKQKEDFGKIQVVKKSQDKSYSPKRFSGIKQKIGALGTGSTHAVAWAPDSRRQPESAKKQLDTSKSFTSTFFMRSPPSKPELSKSGSAFLLEERKPLSGYNSRQKNLSEVIPLNQLLELRNRIQQADTQSISQLSPNYISELLRLAQAITNSVKKIR